MEDVLDVENLAVLCQRKYTFMKDVKDLTDEISDVLSGNDGYTAELLLEERMDKLRKVQDTTERIQLLGEAGPKAAYAAHRLIYSEPENIEPENPDEKLVKEIRIKTRSLIKELQDQDRRLNMQLARDQSFYKE
ncbi:hypothetical protein SAMN05216349_11240 [Oribacterium sp. KHPX15]|uniref:hypothetical protein n=1 Tax=unclassified Oribacterium TaxID=2629782 RepID=UPI0004E1092E|nr:MULTISPECIES: hypothetical protein [unclassified Oribacterium]SEA42788.1 hypothetical protein SAMN05216349_11240 [Oribacterium sp. KHPX15]